MNLTPDVLTTLLAAAVTAVCVTAAATRALIPLLWRMGFWDIPNHRSSHTAPKPRGGGLAIWIGIAAALVLLSFCEQAAPHWSIIAGTGLVALVGLVDDRLRGISAGLRLLVQLVAACLVVSQLGGLDRLPLPTPADVPLAWLAGPLAVFWLLAVANLFNFLDGIDGFAALQGAIAGLGLALVSQDSATSACGAAIAGACLGFLPYNKQPSKVFMGDVGAPALGFLLAALPLQAGPTQRGGAVLAAVLLLWFFLADGVFTLLRRLVRGEKVWQAHRSHLYQRLVAAGWSHRSVARSVMAAALGVAAIAVGAQRSDSEFGRWLALGIALAAMAGYVWIVNRCEHPRVRTHPALVSKVALASADES